jgi:hypothetical protein
MKRLLFLLSVAAALALPATALAKGPSEARITGPGLAKAIKISGQEVDGSPIMNLADAAGFFPAAFGQTPNPMSSAPPKSTLGPRYSLDYVVPGGNLSNFKIHQDLYPYAKSGGWTHTPAGQPIFGIEGGTHGGWFHDARLKGILVARGLPKDPPTVSSSANSRSSDSAGFFSTGKIGAFVLVLFGIGAAAVLTRRHLRGTAT